MKNKIIALVIVLVITIAFSTIGFFVAEAIATSDMPEWLKLYLLTR